MEEEQERETGKGRQAIKCAFSRRNSNGQKTHEKMLTISSNKGNAN
jgi:hypothetical protein